ncbi:extracellular catalytic domain type 1 short-chain-length polyhydroxyalkanoate depolymerase [Jannaschia rubra]|uniref:Esterase, PHB depolymerase family n=1 Tax=Jannaschia rubra TaxID=282197 RepID=A0A0M6XLQ4_9RHOB|nr:PHB depolymerase family esterase [Jannaschia rubra]CTQ32120.1 esterase, PHB depolymerase family [Jannaschia rubra]SFG37157.1 esterase, PHB depolymerase family [Jannaschia rubra]
MDHLFTGAPRPADDTRGSRLDAAGDLVRRTLAQHGLLPGTSGEGAAPQAPHDVQGTIARALAQAGLGGAPAAPADPIPDGAVLRTDTFTGQSGSRDCLTYIPASAARGVTGVVMMLHGCTQNPQDFAKGTGMNALAETHRFVVVYPAQARGANAQSCWNWFSKGDQRRDRGEPEILAIMARAAMAEHGVTRDRTFVAGLSAGAAMAVILGETYPDIFAAVGAHSGLPFGAASDVASAFAAMSGQGAEQTPPSGTSDLRTIVFHGTADTTVHPSNGAAIARGAGRHGPDVTVSTDDAGQAGGRRYRRNVTADADGTPLTEHWVVEGLGHAWSGGRPGGSHTDAAGPDASAQMVRFFLDPARPAT